MNYLVGDIGGTKIDLALYEKKHDQFICKKSAHFKSQDFSGLDLVLKAFLENQTTSIQAACLGIPGQVVGGVAKLTNLPWVVDRVQLKAYLNCERFHLVNDLEAIAVGISGLKDEDLVILNKGERVSTGNQAVLAAGTGLGLSALFWDGASYRPFATEGGHVDFSPQSDLEIDLLQFLMKRFGHVSYERVLSGPGLVNIYQFFKEKKQLEEPAWLREKFLVQDPASVITMHAMQEKALICVETLNLFVAIYGAEAGNVALKLMTRGGLFIAGGIAPKIIDQLRTPLFMEKFLEKGRMGFLLETIPVKVVMNPRVALLGALKLASD